MYDFDENDINYVVDMLMDDLPNLEKLASTQIGFVLGGQPGAGKTVIEKLMKSKFENIVIVNGDDYRKYHPQFDIIVEERGADYPEYTSKFSSAVTELFIDKLIEQKRDIIVEGTLRTIEAPLKTCQKMKANGYETYLGIMAVKPELSYLITIYRYEEMLKNGMLARKTPEEHHDKVVRSLVDNCKKIFETGVFDEILIFDRRSQCISKSSAQKPYKILNDVVNGKWTKNEYDDFKIIYQKTLEMKKNRSAIDVQEFIRKFGETYKKNEKMSDKEL